MSTTVSWPLCYSHCENHCVTTAVWGPLCHDHCVITTVSWPLCHNHCVMTTVWQLLWDGHCVMTTVWQLLSNGHCVMARVWRPLCDNHSTIVSCPLCFNSFVKDINVFGKKRPEMIIKWPTHCFVLFVSNKSLDMLERLKTKASKVFLFRFSCRF